jgi:hypothetical protein
MFGLVAVASLLLGAGAPSSPFSSSNDAPLLQAASGAASTVAAWSTGITQTSPSVAAAAATAERAQPWALSVAITTAAMLLLGLPGLPSSARTRRPRYLHARRRGPPRIAVLR